MSGIAAPELLTSRLRLREHRADDLDASAAMWGDADVVRFIGGKPFSRSDVWARLLRYAGMWRLLGYGFWVVEDRTTGAFLGEVGFMDAKRDIDPAIVDPEAGWAFARHAHGCGFASEALAAAFDWADREIAAPCIACMIEDGNDVSRAVAAKFEFHSYARTTFSGSPVELFRRARILERKFAKA